MQKQKPGPMGHFVAECSSIVEGCRYSARGDTSDEVTQRLMAHAKNEHDVPVTAETVARARNAVRDDND